MTVKSLLYASAIALVLVAGNALWATAEEVSEANDLVAANAHMSPLVWRQDGQVRVAVIGSNLTGFSSNAINFSPTGDRFVTQADHPQLGPGVFLFDTASSAVLARLDAQAWFSFSADGHRVFEVARSNGTGDAMVFSIYDASSGRRLSQTPLPLPVSISLDRSGQIGSLERDGVLRVYRMDTGAETLHLENLWLHTISVDGSRLIAQTYDRKARIYDTATGSLVAELPGTTDRFLGSLTSQYMLTEDGEARLLRVFDLQSGELLWTLPTGYFSDVYTLSSEADILLRTPPGADLQDAALPEARDIRTGKVVHTFDAPFRMINMNARLMLADAGGQHTVIWDLKTFQPRFTLPYQIRGDIDNGTQPAISADGRFVVVEPKDDPARLDVWDTERGVKVWTGVRPQETRPDGSIWLSGRGDASFNPDGTLLVRLGRHYHFVDLSAVRDAP